MKEVLIKRSGYHWAPGDTIGRWKLLGRKDPPSSDPSPRRWFIECTLCGHIRISILYPLSRDSCRVCVRKSNYGVGAVWGSWMVVEVSGNSEVTPGSELRYRVQCLKCKETEEWVPGTYRGDMKKSPHPCRKCKGFSELSYSVMSKNLKKAGRKLSKERVRQLLTRNPELTYSQLMTLDWFYLQVKYMRKPSPLPYCIRRGKALGIKSAVKLHRRHVYRRRKLAQLSTPEVLV